MDLVLRGDTVVTPQGVAACDIVISGGTIESVAPLGTVTPEGEARLIDATGRIVMPGGIDPHVHCAWPMPGPEGQVVLTEPASVVSRAAIHGGTTTLIDFVRCSDGSDVTNSIERLRAGWHVACHTDYAFHLMV